MQSLKSIGGDGNCLFRALCYIISGLKDQHLQVHAAIVAHMWSIDDLVSGIRPDDNRNYLVTYDGGYSSVEDYLRIVLSNINYPASVRYFTPILRYN